MLIDDVYIFECLFQPNVELYIAEVWKLGFAKTQNGQQMLMLSKKKFCQKTKNTHEEI